jgi:CBS domain containing-hemolysin-like protein
MLTQIVARSPHSVNETVVTHAADNWPWVRLSDPITDVLEALETKNIRFICVVDEEGRVAGLTGQKGLMEYVAEHFPGQVMVQRIGGTPYLHEREGA